MTASSETVPVPNLPDLAFRYVSMTDPLAEFMLSDLQAEYDRLYPGQKAAAPENKEINKYPATAFSAEAGGAFLLLLSGRTAVAGGAIMVPYDKLAQPGAAEFKRIWSHPNYRRQGLVKYLMQELESEAVRLGYTSVYLTTGPAQPQAVSLYQNLGYKHRPIEKDGEVLFHAFTKPLDDRTTELEH